MNEEGILVCLYSDANPISISLLEILLSKNCFVLIVGEDVEEWEFVTKHLASKSRFSIVKPKDIKKTNNFNYIIFCSGFTDKTDAYKSFATFSENKYLRAPKILTVFPFEVFNAKEDSLIGNDDRLGTIYLGDVIGPRMDLESNLLCASLIRRGLEKREMVIATGEVFYPVFLADAAKMIAKWIFSFGPYGKSIFLLGPQTSASDFWLENNKIIGNLKLRFDNRMERRFVPRNHEIKILPGNLGRSLTETYHWLSQTPARIYTKAVKQEQTKKARLPRKARLILASLAFILVLPIIFLLLSLGLSYFSYKNILSNNGNRAKPTLIAAKTLFVGAQIESKILKFIPGLGLVYRETDFISSLGVEVTDAGMITIPLVEKGSELFESVLGDNVYDPSLLSQELSTGISELTQSLIKIESLAKDGDRAHALSAKMFLQKVDIERARKLAEQGKIFSENLPSFLGAGGRKTYLVLFQNNMELRPTGGFIGSFGLLTLDGGRMTDLTVNDVYSADGQLRGHVEPPEPIKNYLGEANWWLRDSNWDPDFPTSAKRAEWFLDKEIDQKVDGVFAIDLNIVKDALKLTGPIFLADYNLNITSDNIYEKTQAEAEEEFFPGSHQKASFLTALSRNLVNYTENLEKSKKILLLASFFNNLEQRHLQVFLHNDSLQKALAESGWSGEVLDPSCGDGCYADLVGVTEANVGVNKANYFIDRTAELNVKITKESIERQLTLDIKNSANTALGARGKYKVYLRIFVPQDSVLTSAKGISGEYTEDLKTEVTQTHGRYEAGVLVEVLGGTSKKLVFVWSTKPDLALNMDTYGVYVRKQGGVNDHPWTVNIFPVSSSLTKTGAYTYNTVLSKDFFAKVNLYK